MFPYQEYERRVGPLKTMWLPPAHPDWGEDISVLSDGHFRQFVYGTPLVVVHPGFFEYFPDESLPDESLPDELVFYQKYKYTLRSTLYVAAAENRSIIVYTPTEYRPETLKFIGIPRESVLLVPTVNRSTRIDHAVSGILHRDFYRRLSHYISEAEICGEYRQQCVQSVENDLTDANLHVTRLYDAIF